MNPLSRIFISDHWEMMGYAITQKLISKNYTNLILPPAELDLLDKNQVSHFFQETKPEYIFLSTGKQGGIKANIQSPAEFMYDNLQKQINVIHASYESSVKKLLYLASACVYPKNCLQPMKEDFLMTGPLEITNEAYATAKLAGIKMCQAYNQQYKTEFISAIPTNIFGPRDNFDLENAHVCSALIRKIHEATLQEDKSLTLWGSGKPCREFLYVSDLADACVFLMEHYQKTDPINIGSDEYVSIKELAFLVAEVVGFKGDIKFDTSYPDGMPAKILDISKLTALKWKHKTSLQEGIRETYKWYLGNF